jgi:hypothetical protein
MKQQTNAVVPAASHFKKARHQHLSIQDSTTQGNHPGPDHQTQDKDKKSHAIR